MSKTTKNKSAEEAAKLFVENIKKKGFIIYMDRLQTACDTLDDPGLGRVFRNINEYVHNPHHLPNFADRGEYVNYQYMVGGIRDNNEEWKEKIIKRRLRYENDKQKTSNFDNNGNFDKTGETENLQLPIKNSTQINIQSSAQSSSQSNLTTTNVVSSQSKKQFQSKFKDTFSDKEYTLKYLNEKKIFFTEKGFEEFYDFNCELGWPYDAARAARNFQKLHPETKKAPEKRKEAPQPPATPPKLQEAKEQILQALRETVSLHDFNTWFKDLELLEIVPTVDGDKITVGIKSKGFAEYFRDTFEGTLKDAYKIITGSNVLDVWYCFVDEGQIKQLIPLRLLPPAPEPWDPNKQREQSEAQKKTQAAREKALQAFRSRHAEPTANVYAEQPPAPAEA